MIALEFTDAEVALLHTLLEQYGDLVQQTEGDPVLDRLFPVAYRDDPDAAAEFSRYTRSGLVDHKTSASGAITAALAGGGSIELATEDAERWLPVLTDLRLIIAERIGITDDDDTVPDDALGQVYHWLAQLQTYMIEAIEVMS